MDLLLFAIAHPIESLILMAICVTILVRSGKAIMGERINVDTPSTYQTQGDANSLPVDPLTTTCPLCIANRNQTLTGQAASQSTATPTVIPAVTSGGRSASTHAAPARPLRIEDLPEVPFEEPERLSVFEKFLEGK